MTPALVRALLRPHNILLLLSLPLGWSLCSAGTVSSLALIPGTLLMYLAGVIIDLGDPAQRAAAMQQAAARQRQDELELPEDLSGAYRGYAAPALRVRDRVQGYLDSADPTTRQMLNPLAPQFDLLVSGVGRLATKAQQIDRYLGSETTKELQRQIEQFEERLSAATDGEIRAHLQESCAAIRERLSTHTDLRLALERIRSQIESVVDSMEAMYGRVVRIGVADAARAKEERQPVTDHINALLEAIEETDRHVSQIAGVSRSS